MPVGYPFPVFICRIAFASSPYTDSPSWDDVSDDLISFSIKRGRQHQLDRFEAGTAVILLDNTDGHYWPNNAGGDHYPNIRIGKRVNIRVTYNDVTYDKYTGFVRRWKPSWLSIEGLLHPTMQLECVDLQRNLARVKLNDEAGYAQEASGARVGHVLDDLDSPDGWPDRDIDTGDALILATGALENVVAMDHLFAVQESELGIFWIKGNGDAVFQERGARLINPYDTSQATFGDGGLPIFDPDLSLDDDLLYNEARLKREGGAEQVYSDASSIVDYGLRTLSKSGLLLTDDDIVFLYCLFFVARFQETRIRAKSITIKPQVSGSESSLWPIVLGFEISTRVTLIRTEAGINSEYFIEGIEDSYDYREGVWVTKYQLSDASTYLYEPDATQATIRPTANGDHIGLNYQFPVADAHWDKVDEEETDEDATYVQMNASAGFEGYDLYELEDLPIAKGTASKITIYMRMRRNGTETHTSYPRIRIKTHGTVYGYQYVEPGNTWANISQELTLNPFTGEAWTVEEVNDLQIGPTCDPGTFDTKQVRCTQVWVVVDYIPGW